MRARIAAWLVHGYTSLGLVCAAGMTVLVVQGDDASVRWALFLMMVATAIDASDGWFARRARVKEVVPGFDGSALDNLIDFQTYTSIPLFLLWTTGAMGPELGWVLLLPLLASAYGFSQVHAKTHDGFFLGFPSYWNITAYYIYLLRMPPWFAVSIVVCLSVLTFVPTRYLYASRGGPFALVINVGAVVYFVMLALGLAWTDATGWRVVFASLAYPALYLSLSALVTLRMPRRR